MDNEYNKKINISLSDYMHDVDVTGEPKSTASQKMIDPIAIEDWIWIDEAVKNNKIIPTVKYEHGHFLWHEPIITSNKYIYFNDLPITPVTKNKEETEMAVKKTTKAAAQKNVDLQKAWLDGYHSAKTTSSSNVTEFNALVQSHFPTPPVLPELKTVYFYEKLSSEYVAMAVRYNPNINTFEIAAKAHYYPISEAANGQWNKVKFGTFYPVESADPKKSHETFFYHNSHYVCAFWMSTFFKNQKLFDELKANPFINADHDPIPDYVHKIWKALNPTAPDVPVVFEKVEGGVEKGELGITIAKADEDIEYFEVDSETDGAVAYKVEINKTTDVHKCTCKSYIFSKKKPKTCKHITEVLDSMDFADELNEIKSKLKSQKNDGSEHFTSLTA